MKKLWEIIGFIFACFAQANTNLDYQLKVMLCIHGFLLYYKNLEKPNEGF